MSVSIKSNARKMYSKRANVFFKQRERESEGEGEGEGRGEERTREGESAKCRRHAPGAMVTSVTQEGAADGINNNSVWMFSARVFMRARQHVPVGACTGVAVCILSQASRMRV